MKKTFLLIIVTLTLVGAACDRRGVSQEKAVPALSARRFPTTTPVTSTSNVQWQLTENGWKPMGIAPDCPVPFSLSSPTDMATVTSILYPGQTRGGNYKPHGGFRFDTITNNRVTVTSPVDGQIVRGAQYLVNGEIQYTWDMIHLCGMMVRLGHLRELTPKFQAIVANFPAAQENDSRTNTINLQVAVTAGETIATKVGITAEQNTFFDLGVYDLRQKNRASEDPAYAAAHGEELDQHALCWLTMLPPADAERVLMLPAGDPSSGTLSDYCGS